MADKKKDFYEILNLRRDCKSDEIRKSFIELSKECHPDRHPNLEYSHEKFLDICEAYNTLSNTFKRQKYDEFLSQKSKITCDVNKAYGHGSSYGFSAYQSSSNTNRNNTTRFLLKLTLLPKAVIFATLVFISLFGAGIQFNFIRNNASAKMAQLENKSIMSGIMVDYAREQAKKYGNEEQLKRLENGLLGQFDATEILDKYIKETYSKSKHK